MNAAAAGFTRLVIVVFFIAEFGKRQFVLFIVFEIDIADRTAHAGNRRPSPPGRRRFIERIFHIAGSFAAFGLAFGATTTAATSPTASTSAFGIAVGGRLITIGASVFFANRFERIFRETVLLKPVLLEGWLFDELRRRFGNRLRNFNRRCRRFGAPTGEGEPIGQRESRRWRRRHGRQDGRRRRCLLGCLLRFVHTIAWRRLCSGFTAFATLGPFATRSAFGPLASFTL